MCECVWGGGGGVDIAVTSSSYRGSRKHTHDTVSLCWVNPKKSGAAHFYQVSESGNFINPEEICLCYDGPDTKRDRDKNNIESV